VNITECNKVVLYCLCTA